MKILNKVLIIIILFGINSCFKAKERPDIICFINGDEYVWENSSSQSIMMQKPWGTYSILTDSTLQIFFRNTDYNYNQDKNYIASFEFANFNGEGSYDETFIPKCYVQDNKNEIMYDSLIYANFIFTNIISNKLSSNEISGIFELELMTTDSTINDTIPKYLIIDKGNFHQIKIR